MRKLLLSIVLLCLLPLVSASLFSDLNSYYQFQETSGPKNDSLGRFNMTLTGGTLTTTNGLIGNAYRGDDTNMASWGTVFSGMKNITLSFWFNHTNDWEGAGQAYFFANGSNVNAQYSGALTSCGGVAQGTCLTLNVTSGDAVNNATILNDSRWHSMIYTIDMARKNVTLYYDGQVSGSGELNMSFMNQHGWFGGFRPGTSPLSNNVTVDELGVWNRTLTSDEIATLYNNGNGRSFAYLESTGSHTLVTLISPPNGSTSSVSTINFEATLLPAPFAEVNVTNATLYIWHANSTLERTTVNITNTGNITGINFTEENLVIGNYMWNVLGCSSNLTFSTCDFAENNFTFQRTFVSFNQTFYNTTVWETAYELFSLNLTLDPSVVAVTPFLVYNGTSYLATSSCNASGFCQASRSIDIPLIHQSGQDHTFYWSINVFDGTSNGQSNSSIFNQTVTQIFLSQCSTVANYTLNFTAYDEQNLSRINPFMFAGTFNSWLGTGSQYRNFSFNIPSAPEVTLCISPREVPWKTNADIEYNNATLVNYNTRNYYFRNATLLNNSQPIPLYLLKSVDSTSFILEVTDENLVALNDTLIYIQRFYPGNNTYNTVQIAITDNNGKSVGFFETETVEYKFILVRYGQVILQTEKRKVFPETSPFTLTFRVGTQAGSIFTPYQNLTNIFYTLTYNETTRMVDYTYIDVSGTTQLGRLLVQINNPSGLPTTICNVNSTQASATLLCNVTGYSGSIIARGYISRSPEQLVALLNSFIETATEIFGGSGMLMGILILLAVALITIYNPILQIISLNVVLLGLSLIGIVTFSPIFIFGFIAVSVLILILLRL